MPTEMELTLEQTQQGVSYEVSVDPHGSEGYLKMEVEKFKKDETLNLFKSTNQERYEYVSPEVTSSQDGKVYKMAKRLCLVDDLKILKITMSNSSSRNKLNLEINDHYNILTGEC
ncbi:hypothetical protein Tco_0597353 [Tanacetum coccineum]